MNEEKVKINWKGQEVEITLKRPSFVAKNKAAKAAVKTVIDQKTGEPKKELDDMAFQVDLLKTMMVNPPADFDLNSEELDFAEGDKLLAALTKMLRPTEEEEKK